MRSFSRGCRVLREREAGAALVSDIVYSAGAFLERHQHSRPYISVLIEGTYTELCDGLPRACSPGTVIVHPQAEEHSDYFLSAGRCLNIEVPSAWIGRDDAEARRSIAVHPSSDRRIEILQAFAQMRSTPGSVTFESAVRELAGATLAEESYSCGAPPAWLPAILERFPWTEAVPLAHAALGAGVHQTHFAREFRRHVGVTASYYRTRVRLRRASRLLLESPAPLADVAQASGFSDQSHFSNTFRSVTGMAPGAYRSVFSA